MSRPRINAALLSSVEKERNEHALKLVMSEATIAAHEKTIADLEAKVKDLSQWPAIAHEMARNNTRLTGTLDNMAKAAAGLVPPSHQALTSR
jgi:predicted solute-binding protein